MSRILEMVGYSLSFIVLVFALATFCYFRSVKSQKIGIGTKFNKEHQHTKS